jgi:hypothetical protein
MMGAWLKKKFPLFDRLSIPTLIVGQRPARGLCPRRTLDVPGSTRMTMRRGLADAVKAQTDLEFSEQSWLTRTEDHREGVRAAEVRRQGRFIDR